MFRAGCDEELDKGPASYYGGYGRFESSSPTVIFNIKNGAQEVDLVAAKADDTCPAELGVAINVTDEIREAPSWVLLSDYE